MPEPWEALLLALACVALLPTLYHALRTGVPPVACSAAEARAVARLLQEARLPAGARVYEVGCGWGGLARTLAAALPEAEIRGVEISPLPFVVAWLRARQVPNLQISWDDAHRLDLSAADAVVAYLMIGAMPRLAVTLDRCLAAGTPVVTVLFRFRGRTPALPTGEDGARRADVVLYRWPAEPAAEGPPAPGTEESRSQAEETRPNETGSVPSA